MSKLVISIVNDKGIPFNIVAILPGDKYGLADCLVNDTGNTLIEFYDARYMHDEHGQFISRYYLSTLLRSQSGLLIDAGVPSWSIDATAMKIVRRSLNYLDKN